MTSVHAVLPIPPNPLSALNIGSDLINARACSGYWFVLQAADQSLAHAEALLEQERVACRAEHREVAP